MIGRTISHIVALKFEAWKLRRKGFHVVIVDRSPDFILMENVRYRVHLRDAHQKVAILFSHTFEYSLRPLITKVYSRATVDETIGYQSKELPQLFTGICIKNSHNFRVLSIENTEPVSSTEFDYEVNPDYEVI